MTDGFIMNRFVDKKTLERLFQLITTHTGMIIRINERKSLQDFFTEKSGPLAFQDMETYCRILESGSDKGSGEWEELIGRITIGESYFFRDKGQFHLLEKKILPELINMRKKEKTLRLWSAGCSSGEEAYSLAILAARLIPEPDEWKVTITGTDINRDSIIKAQKGSYGEWSFRRIDPDIKSLYFKRKGDKWEIAGQIRRMAEFRTMNLILDEIPNHRSDIHDMDLILCRNLFIYFSRDSVAKVIKKLENTLNCGGYLMTGHGELHDQKLGSLSPLIFQESVIYRKEDSLKEGSPQTFISISAENKARIAQELQKPCHITHEPDTRPTGYSPGGRPESESGVPGTIQANAGYLGDSEQKYTETAAFAKARESAARGLYSEAGEQLKLLLKNNPDLKEAYLLLAQISEILGDIEKAKEYLKKVIYLDHGAVAAYLELGSIYNKEHNAIRAEKMLTTALDLIRALPPETRFEIYDGISAGELGEYVSKTLEDGKKEGSYPGHH